MRRDRKGNTVPVGGPGHVEFLFIDARYIRYRCTDRNCPERRAARERGNHAYHVFDTITHERWTEEEPAPVKRRAS